MRTGHSPLRYLPSQTTVNARVWKWVSILQGYNLEIQHIPGKINTANHLSRQLKNETAHQKGQVNTENREFVEQIQVLQDTSDDQIIDALSKVLRRDSNRKSVQCLPSVSFFRESVSKIRIQAQDSVVQDSVDRDPVHEQAREKRKSDSGIKPVDCKL